MKDSCTEIPEAKFADSSDRAKKLYRYVTDIGRRIDEATASCQSICDHFSTTLEVHRQKLRDNCEKLFFLDPLNYGKKSVDLLWRKVYYDTVSAVKKLRETQNENDNYLFTHLVCGIGHFHNFITRIQSEMKIHLKELDYIPLYTDEETVDIVNSSFSEEYVQFGRSTIHSCLVYLGDLSRYQAEYFQTFDPSIAARYYLQAAQIDKCSGMPYNQLGNLYLEKNYNLDSVGYYIHCLSCVSPFQGAMGNLAKIFEKCVDLYEKPIQNEAPSQAEHIQNMVGNFLALIEIWYFGKTDPNISQRCNTIAHQLKIAIDFNIACLPTTNNYTEYLQALHEENINPSYLNGSVVHKIVQICLFTLVKISETDESKAFACKAFSLALLSQLLQKLLKQLESIGLKSPANKYPKFGLSEINTVIQEDQFTTEISEYDNNITKVMNGNNDTIDIPNTKEQNTDELNKKNQNGDTKNSKKILPRRRRRRRIDSSGSSDISDTETSNTDVDTDKSSSDDENTSDSSCHSDGESISEGSNIDGSETENTDKINTGIKEIANNDTKENIVVVNDATVAERQIKQDTELNLEGIQNFLLGNNFLPSIKLLQDWLIMEKELILSCGDSGEPLFQCVVDLLNIFTYYFDSKNNDNVESKNIKILNYAVSVAKNLKLEHKKIPLPEDINLRGTNICKFDKDAAEWQILDKYKPTTYEENIIRILNFIDFGNQIVKILPRIRFNRSLRIYYLKKIPSPKLNIKFNHKRSREWHNSKNKHTGSSEGGLLRRLGQLWLASQVRELERSGQSPAPAFLALDAAALYKHLRRVKQLLRARNFILLVPAVALQELDDLKREKSMARDAIRWLEAQLRSGSRYLRAQRPGQSKSLPLLKYPRKAPSHVQNFIQILEFCNHFIADEKQHQGGNGDPENSLQTKSSPLLLLLVGNELNNDEVQCEEFNLPSAAETCGISVEYIIDFYKKWRQSLHKTGKKR